MRVLVTGGTGFVGSHTVRALQGAGHDVRLLVRDRSKVDRVYPGSPPDCVVGDVTDEGSVERALSGCDAVVHAAGSVSIEAKRAEEMMRTNGRGAELVVGGAVRQGIPRILYVSSVSALFLPGGAPFDLDGEVRQPATAYGRSKADAERRVRALQAEGAPLISTYPAAVIGPDDPGVSESNHAILVFLRDVFITTSGGFQVIDVRDLARIHVGLLESCDGPGRFAAAGRFLPWGELRELLDELTGDRVRGLSVPGRLLRVAGRAGDALRRVWSFDFPMTHEAMTLATMWREVDGSATVERLGLSYRDSRETYADTLRWLVRAGHLDRERIGPLAE